MQSRLLAFWAMLLFSALALAAVPLLGQPETPLAGNVLGKAVHTADAEELRFYVLRELTGRYAEQKVITVSQDEIAGYQRHLDAFIKQNAGRHAETPAAVTPMSAEEKAARDEIAAAFIRQWKINGTLYRQYGGRVAFQQGGPEPIDAYRMFLEEAQVRGDFTIADKGLEAGFWDYFRNDAKHNFYPSDSKETKQLFDSPPWESSAAK